MGVSFNPVSQNNFLNVHRVNQSIARSQSAQNRNQAERAERRDTVTIAPLGRAQSLLENLMKQKIKINDQKNSLISATIENGGTMDSISEQLESYDEQLKNIDAQVAQMMAKEMEDKTQAAKGQGDDEPKTEEEIQNKRMNALTDLSVDLTQAQTMRSIKTKIDGAANILQAEIELDKQSAGSSVGAKKLIATKEDALTSLEGKSMELSAKIAEKLADVSEKPDEDNTLQGAMKTELEAENANGNVLNADAQGIVEKMNTLES